MMACTALWVLAAPFVGDGRRAPPPRLPSGHGHPQKPPLLLTFHTWLHTANGDVQEVSADARHLKVALWDAGPMSPNGTLHSAPSHDGVILDFEHGRRLNLQRFFRETVCYELDLFSAGAGYGAGAAFHAAVARIINSATRAIIKALPHLIDERYVHSRQLQDLFDEARAMVVRLRSALQHRVRVGTRHRNSDGNASTARALLRRTETEAVFEAALGEVFGAPLALYEDADNFVGVRAVGGRRCFAWEERMQQHVKLTSMLNMTVVFSSLSAASVGSLQSSLGNLTREALSGAALFSTSTLFCVATSGEILATNVSHRVEVQGAGRGPMRTLWEEVSRTSAVAAPGRPPSIAEFERKHGVAGSSCVDLTHGTSGPRELEADLNDAARLRTINAEAGRHWEAGAHRMWDGFKVAEVAPTLGTQIQPLQLPLRRGKDVGLLAVDAQPKSALPASFDARAHWSECLSIGLVRNQGKCGSCWAFAAATVLADRFCIAAFKRREPFRSLMLAPEHLVDCDGGNSGCSGGRLDSVWWFLRDHGIPVEPCAPYRFCPEPTDPHCRRGAAMLDPELPSPGANGSAPSQRCQAATCAGDNTPMQLYRASVAYGVSLPGDVAGLQRELFEHGPVEVGFFVFSDFLSYRRGTYFRTPGAYGPLGGHAVRLLGWGTDHRRTDYWFCANSWSPEWGRSGFFQIRRGTNECGIETTPAAGLPKLDDTLVDGAGEPSGDLFGRHAN
mmetsp:Transcript_20503/g.57415  ORF Transcript_20503/g.57415 Transcript_20503/m.57415 type:complete len:731 (+) Transcript_20503:140-2332(+)